MTETSVIGPAHIDSLDDLKNLKASEILRLVIADCRKVWDLENAHEPVRFDMDTWIHREDRPDATCYMCMAGAVWHCRHPEWVQEDLGEDHYCSDAMGEVGDAIDYARCGEFFGLMAFSNADQADVVAVTEVYGRLNGRRWADHLSPLDTVPGDESWFDDWEKVAAAIEKTEEQ